MSHNSDQEAKDLTVREGSHISKAVKSTSLRAVRTVKPIEADQDIYGISDVESVRMATHVPQLDKLNLGEELLEELQLIRPQDLSELSQIQMRVNRGELTVEDGLKQTLMLALTSSLSLPEALSTSLLPELERLVRLHPELMEQLMLSLKE